MKTTVFYTQRLSTKDNTSLNLLVYHLTTLAVGLEKESANGVECFTVDQDSQAYNIYLIFYVSVGNYGSRRFLKY